MGSVSDRSNPKYFLPLGLLLSCARHGRRPASFKAIYASLALVIVLQIAQWLGPGHGLAAVRQDDGALVQHQGARPASSRSGTSRTTSAAALVATFALLRRDAVSRLGREVLLQRGDRRGGRRRRVLPAARHAAVAAACRRSRNTRTTTRRTTHAASERTFTYREIFVEHVLTNKLPLGDRGRQRVRLFRALRRGELDSDLSADGERILVQPVEHRRGRSTSSPRFPARSRAAGCRTRCSKGAARRRRSCSWR